MDFHVAFPAVASNLNGCEGEVVLLDLLVDCGWIAAVFACVHKFSSVDNN